MLSSIFFYTDEMQLIVSPTAVTADRWKVFVVFTVRIKRLRNVVVVVVVLTLTRIIKSVCIRVNSEYS